MKFKVGDRVKVNNLIDNPFKQEYYGRIGTIVRNEKVKNENRWILDFNPIWVFYDDELELAEEVNITINPNDRAGAHKAVEDAIAKYKKKKAEWTEDELAQARELFKELIVEWCLDNHKGYCFLTNVDKTRCTLFDPNVIVTTPRKGPFYERVAETEISGNDVFDETIGKVVLLCKALKKPIPDFINNKNR